MADETSLSDFPSLFSLKGKVAVVTGGSRGLGLNAASAFLQAGCSQVFITSRKAAACEQAVAQLNALPNLAPGARAISVPADSSTLAGIRSLVEQVRQHASHVDILFANAGATWGAPFDEHPDGAFQKVMDLNVKSVFLCVQQFAPLLERRATVDDPARVIVTASTAGVGVGSLGAQATFAYSASKAAAIHLARNLAVDLGPRHVLVNSICPGFFPTKMANGLLAMTGGVDKHAQGNPARRLGRPEDIAGAVVYLASRAGSHVNGAAITIDGGAVWSRGALHGAGEAASPKPKL
ncbi:NAD(P)-binding protein [Hypoxylon sp. FL1284]|nr:NAD(P)-binding protein [Hypoxylon sp. FL1284]